MGEALCLEGFFMSYAIGRNELKSLLEKETRLQERIAKSDADEGTICSFETIVLKKEMEKVRTRLRVLSYMIPSGNPDDDELA